LVGYLLTERDVLSRNEYGNRSARDTAGICSIQKREYEKGAKAPNAKAIINARRLPDVREEGSAVAVLAIGHLVGLNLTPRRMDTRAVSQ
jgi:hypothetical protein